MSTDTVIHGLNGAEIINDLLFQLEKHLKRDCNLRHSDCYEGGYYAKVHIEMKLHGIDIAPVETSLAVGDKNDRPGTTVDETLEVPVDQRLDIVRTRSKQKIPSAGLEKLPDDPMDTQVPQAPKSRYERVAPHPVGNGNGGATGETLETD